MTSTSTPSLFVQAASVSAFVISGLFGVLSVFFALGAVLLNLRPAGTTTPHLSSSSIIVVLSFLLGMAVFGTITGIGLRRLRGWARSAAIWWAGIDLFVFVSVIAVSVLAQSRRIQRTSHVPAIFAFIFTVIVCGPPILAGVWWLVLFNRKSVVEQFADSENIPNGGEYGPFRVIRGRALLGRLLIAIVGTAALILIGGRIWSGRSFDFRSPLASATSAIAFYGVLLILVLHLIRRAHLKPVAIFGSAMRWDHLRGYRLLPVFLIGVSMASYFILFFPLSFGLPRFVNWFLFQPSTNLLIHTSGNGYSLANMMNMLTAVWIAPVVEELVFRGLLLTRWSVKWSVPRGILLTSVIFGLMHKEILGHMFFGYVMAVLYIETKSLFVPMFMHIANNGIAWALGVSDVVWGSGKHSTLFDFQSHWHLNLAISAVFIPWAIWFFYRHRPESGWRIPFADDPQLQTLTFERDGKIAAVIGADDLENQ